MPSPPEKKPLMDRPDLWPVTSGEWVGMARNIFAFHTVAGSKMNNSMQIETRYAVKTNPHLFARLPWYCTFSENLCFQFCEIYSCFVVSICFHLFFWIAFIETTMLPSAAGRGPRRCGPCRGSFSMHWLRPNKECPTFSPNFFITY